MIKKNKSNNERNGCKDVFKSFLVTNCEYDGMLEIPIIKKETDVPRKLIPFSKAKTSSDKNCYVHFYEDDVRFERIWNNPERYLTILKEYDGVISPDFSLYRDMPLVMQQWNVYRNRAIGTWLQSNGIKVIPNIRFSDSRSYEFCCLGVENGSVIAIGTHGTLKNKKDREIFIEGLEYVVNKIKPPVIIIYGKAPDCIFKRYIKNNINVLSFESDYSLSRRKIK
jgi:hypothetical protein